MASEPPPPRGRGRPPRVAGEVASRRIWAFLTPSEWEALQSQAAREGVPVAVLVREALNVYVADAGEPAVISATDKSRSA